MCRTPWSVFQDGGKGILKIELLSMILLDSITNGKIPQHL